MTQEFVTHSPAETQALGERLAAQLAGGEVIAFTGGMGAGKTAFTRGLARGLGITERSLFICLFIVVWLDVG